MIYDLIIIGTGPAGYTAGIYASRYNLKAVLIGAESGGHAAEAYEVENWPGEVKILGAKLAEKFANHCQKLNLNPINENVFEINKKLSFFEVKTEKSSYQSKSIILATGTERRKLNIPGEKEFLGKGVSYCATCDGFFFKNETVAIVGGGNAALMAAQSLAKICKKIYLIYMGDKLLADPQVIKNISSLKNIIMLSNNTITEIIGKLKVEEISLKNPFKNQKNLLVNGMFINIGLIPNNHLAKNLGCDIDKKGFIEIDQDMQTSIPGAFAAGDVTNGSGKFQQIIIAAGEGAQASHAAFKYIKNNFPGGK